ncbi:hypothetical protein SOCEGT47_057680 [Sorangium cellulosum]|uniref:Uncharacterized protein n=1 Tax=Sorangium cellulosum TaxID=56 RepID=A0A4P2Q6U6_SORCE|nr:hypothetical protein [Sorangium cellulosum]AUX25224.1 hypothetical protein SOCEGT47_057680 [Sorangium cellulosum]
MTEHDERAELLAIYRPALARLLREAAREGAGASLAAYVLSLREPTGYLIALGLQQRNRAIEPERVLRRALSTGERTPVLAGVLARSALAELLRSLAPATEEMADELERSAPDGMVRVLVAAGGRGEFLNLGEAQAQPG